MLESLELRGKFRVQDSGFSVHSLRFRVYGFRFWIQELTPRSTIFSMLHFASDRHDLGQYSVFSV